MGDRRDRGPARVLPVPVALPVLFRLWHGKGTPSQVALAGEMMSLLAAAFPGRQVHGTGDAAFHGGALVIEDATWTTRLPASAVLYGPKPPPTGKRGRPRPKGAGWAPAPRSPPRRTGRRSP